MKKIETMGAALKGQKKYGKAGVKIGRHKESSEQYPARKRASKTEGLGGCWGKKKHDS